MRKYLILFLVAQVATAQLFGQTDSTRILSLEECVSIAIENNLTIKRSLLQMEGARVNLTQSRAAQLPSVNAGGSYGYNWGRSIDPTSNDFIAQQITFSSMNGNANMTLFNWFNLTNRVKQNRVLLESSLYDADKVRNDISLDVAASYLNVILNGELLESARYQVETGQNQLERTQKLVRAGALPRTSELELISQVTTNEVNLVTAENNLDIAMLNLKQVMLIPASQRIEVIVPELSIEMVSDAVPSAEEIYDISLGILPQIKSAELQIKSAEIGLEVATAGYTPTLSVSGRMSTNYSDIKGIDIEPGLTSQFQDNLSKQLSLNLSIPIFNNLSANSNVQRQKIALEQAEIAILEQKNLLRQMVETAHNDARAAAKVHSASQRQVEALEETFRSVENQFNLGAANSTEYQVASNNLFRAQSDLVRAKYDYIFKKKILDFYQGKTLSF